MNHYTLLINSIIKKELIKFSHMIKKQQKTIKPQDLSIIITTSPIKSHPSTEVIDDSINSILQQPSLKNVHIYIICDGAKLRKQNQYKSGIITIQTMQNYLKYKQIIHQKYNNTNKYTIIQRQQRHGFAQNIKYIMESYATTPHVMIYQHDHVMEKQIDFFLVIETMKKYSSSINYITFMHKNYKNLIPKYMIFPSLKNYLLSLLDKKQSYNLDQHIQQFTHELIEYFNKKYQIPLMPLYFWYDKVHIASRSYYLNVIFNKLGHFNPNQSKNMKTISFVQDTFGHCMKNIIIQQPQKILQYGAYILWEEQPTFYHQSGRSFLTEEEKEKFLKNRQKHRKEQVSDKQDFYFDFDAIEKLQLQPKNQQFYSVGQ